MEAMQSSFLNWTVPDAGRIVLSDGSFFDADFFVVWGLSIALSMTYIPYVKNLYKRTPTWILCALDMLRLSCDILAITSFALTIAKISSTNRQYSPLYGVTLALYFISIFNVSLLAFPRDLCLFLYHIRKFEFDEKVQKVLNLENNMEVIWGVPSFVLFICCTLGLTGWILPGSIFTWILYLGCFIFTQNREVTLQRRTIFRLIEFGVGLGFVGLSVVIQLLALSPYTYLPYLMVAIPAAMTSLLFGSGHLEYLRIVGELSLDPPQSSSPVVPDVEQGIQELSKESATKESMMDEVKISSNEPAPSQDKQ